MKELDQELRVVETPSFHASSFVPHETFPLSREQEMPLATMDNISHTFMEYHFPVRLLVLSLLCNMFTVDRTVERGMKAVGLLFMYIIIATCIAGVLNNV